MIGKAKFSSLGILIAYAPFPTCAQVCGYTLCLKQHFGEHLKNKEEW